MKYLFRLSFAIIWGISKPVLSIGVWIIVLIWTFRYSEACDELKDATQNFYDYTNLPATKTYYSYKTFWDYVKERKTYP